MISLSDLAKGWNWFFHAPEGVATLCVFRILFGSLIAANACTLLPIATELFGPDGLLGPREWQRAYPRPRLSLFHILPATDATARGMVIALMVLATALALGLWTAVTTPLTWLCLVSLHHRNPMVFNAGDSVQRLLLLLLCFAPSGAALSVDSWLYGGSAPALARDRQFDPWPVRLMQIQVCMLYLRSVFWKLQGKNWRNGAAVGYVLQVMPFRRLAAPRLALVPLVTKLLTYGTLVAEVYIPLGVWIRELRYSAILAGWILHLCFELYLNVHLFGITMCVALVVYVPPQDMARLILGGAG